VAPNGTRSMKIEARIYPGVFEGEYQVTISAEGREVHLNVSGDFVQVDDAASEEGTPGFLMVDVVGPAEDEDYLVALPGEPQGATNRVAVPKERLLSVA